jgi:hypothetical protein
MTSCPKCGSDDLYNRWVSERKLQRGCHDCSWKEPPRTPELQVIKNTKLISANQFSGFCFEVYDRYGHIVIFSRSYSTAEKAREELIKELTTHNKHPEYAPCSGVLWPDKVMVIGEFIGTAKLERDSNAKV